MRLKWKLRLYYGALVLALLGVVGAATAIVVRRESGREQARRQSEVARFTQRLVGERLAAIDSAVVHAARDPQLLSLARRDLAGSRDDMLVEWIPLASHLAQRNALPLLKILDGEGRVLSSAHWPASYGLVDSPGLVLALEAPSGARLVRERVAAGDFLALESPAWLPPPRRYVLIGGVRVDSALARDLAQRAGTPLDFEFTEAPAGAMTTSDSTQERSRPGADAGWSWIGLPTSPQEAKGGVRLRSDSSGLEAMRTRLSQIFGLAALAGGVVAWLLGLWISSRVTRPLEELAAAVGMLAGGEVPRPIAVRGSAEVRQLVASFNRMAASLAESREQLRRAERIAAWREVARRVAHEIKNALAPIQLSVDNVARGVHTGRGDLAALVDESVATVRGEVEGLTRLVGAFNEMARLPDPELRPTSLQATWERACAPFRAALGVDSRGVETLPPLMYDDDQVRGVLHNLLLNAQEAGARRVRLEAVRSQHGFELRLSDDGPGIPPADLQRIFEPYFTRKESGSGLGLAIVYKVCADHGWSVAARSPADAAAAPGHQGAVFTISIPASAAAGQASPGELG